MFFTKSFAPLEFFIKNFKRCKPHDPNETVSNFVQVLESKIATCKEIQGSLGFFIPRRKFRIPVTGFWISGTGFQIPGAVFPIPKPRQFRVPQAKFPRFRNSDFFTLCGWLDTICFRCVKKIATQTLLTPIDSFRNAGWFLLKTTKCYVVKGHSQ